MSDFDHSRRINGYDGPEILPTSTRPFQGNQHDAPDPRRLIRGLAGIPVRQGTAGLVFPPEPCDFNEDASCPTVAGLGDPLAPGCRAAVVGARCQPKGGAELSAAGEWSREDLARQDRCTGEPPAP
jgi:hypothetical protein